MTPSDDTYSALDYIDRRRGAAAPNSPQGDGSRYVDEAARQAAHRRKLALTTIGSVCIDIEATPTALPEADGGCTLWIRRWRDTPLEETTAYTVTLVEAKQLVAAIGDVITPALVRPPESSRS